MKKTGTWNSFFAKTKGAPPRDQVVYAVKYVVDKGSALDLGAGTLRDSKYLLEQGFQSVTAVDMEPVVAEYGQELNDDRLNVVISSFDDFDFPVGTYDLVTAQYALPFSSKENFSAMFSKLLASLKPAGVFTGTFFGPNDSWNRPDSKRVHVFLSKDEVLRLFEGFKIQRTIEEEEDGAAVGEAIKHWHKIHVVAKRI